MFRPAFEEQFLTFGDASTLSQSVANGQLPRANGASERKNIDEQLFVYRRSLREMYVKGIANIWADSNDGHPLKDWKESGSPSVYANTMSATSWQRVQKCLMRSSRKTSSHMLSWIYSFTSRNPHEESDEL